jgi:hypothetical protein
VSALRTAAQQALEALEAMNPYPASREDQRAGALAALRAALAQQAEPVGVVSINAKGGVIWYRWPDWMPDGTKLYADLAPRAKPAEPTP